MVYLFDAHADIILAAYLRSDIGFQDGASGLLQTAYAGWIFAAQRADQRRGKEIKDHGIKKPIEGEYKPGETVVLIDDMVTTGASKFEVIQPFESEGLKVNDVVVLLDREQGAKKNLAERGYNLYAVFTLGEALDVLLAEKAITHKVLDKVKKFLADNQA